MPTLAEIAKRAGVELPPGFEVPAGFAPLYPIDGVKTSTQVMAEREAQFVDRYSGPRSALQVQDPPGGRTKPLLLFNGSCRPCRALAKWIVKEEAKLPNGPTLFERPIGNDEEKLRQLHPQLNMAEAYRTVHVLMPDGTLKSDTDAVLEVLKHMPDTKWFAGIFDHQPFYGILDRAYHALNDIRPALGCESCGGVVQVPFWERPLIRWANKLISRMLPEENEPEALPAPAR